MNARDIIKAAATLADCSVSEMVGPTRVASIARVRQAAFLVARETMGLSYPRIGYWFNRDHTTIIFGCRNADPKIAGAVLALAVRFAAEREMRQTPLFGGRMEAA